MKRNEQKYERGKGINVVQLNPKGLKPQRLSCKGERIIKAAWGTLLNAGLQDVGE